MHSFRRALESSLIESKPAAIIMVLTYHHWILTADYNNIQEAINDIHVNIRKQHPFVQQHSMRRNIYI